MMKTVGKGFADKILAIATWRLFIFRPVVYVLIALSIVMHSIWINTLGGDISIVVVLSTMGVHALTVLAYLFSFFDAIGRTRSWVKNNDKALAVLEISLHLVMNLLLTLISVKYAIDAGDEPTTQIAYVFTVIGLAVFFILQVRHITWYNKLYKQ